MAAAEPGAITELLDAAGRGSREARERLWAIVYDDLRQMARRCLANDRRGATLQTTMLVNEAYIRLVRKRDRNWANRRHFFAAAARAMRCICIDQARRRKAGKRGGGMLQCVAQLDLPDGRRMDPDLLLTLDEALTALEDQDPEMAEIVMLRFFVGLTIAETAEVLSVSRRKVDIRWQFARAWLHRELSKGDSCPA